MKEEEEEEDDDERTNGLDDWVHYRHSSPPPVSSSSSSSSSSYLLSPTHVHHYHELTIFPPVNHEGLPISQSTATPITITHLNSSPSHPPALPRNSQLFSWFDLALHLWNSKLHLIIAHLRYPGFSWSLRPVVAVGSILAGLWFWVWRRRKKSGGAERVEQLKLLIKDKDEKILRLLEQIAEMNKALLTRYRIPVLKSN